MSKIESFCPHCHHSVFEVYFADEIRRWRCVYCHQLLSECEYELRDGEFLKKKVRKKREKTGR